MSDAVAASIGGFEDGGAGTAGASWTLGGVEGGVVWRDGGLEEAKLHPAPLGKPIALAAAEGTVAAASPELVRSETALDGAKLSGVLTRWAEDPTDGAELVRHLAIPASDGGTIVLIATRERGAGDHAAERTAAWLVGRDGRAVPFSESLLSTQYDGDGLQTRVGLELWPADPEAPAMRAAATALGAAGVGDVSAAIMRSSAEGAAGLGAYLVWRR